MVLFATPGMMNAGTSLNVFTKWAGEPKNCIIFPGYCSPGTVGNKVLKGDKIVWVENKEIEVKCKVMNMSFSAHTDSKGIIDMINFLEPDNVVLVHGEAHGMRQLKDKIIQELKINCFDPPNHSVLEIETPVSLPFWISTSLISKYYNTSWPSNPVISIPNIIVSKKHSEICKFQTSEDFVTENPGFWLVLMKSIWVSKLFKTCDGLLDELCVKIFEGFKQEYKGKQF